MNKDELARAIVDLNATQTSLATMLELGDRTIRRYCSGTVAIPRVVELAIWRLLDERRRAR
jgi:hypothetical protein